MDDLRINSTDGEHLILESQDGNKHRLLIDDSLRAAIRTPSLSSSKSIQLTPREIQAAIRSGSSVDDLISKSGDPRDYVEKFAQPVLDELTHVLATALGVRISVAGDRYNEVSQTEFGEIISARLAASGVQNISWSTHRDENHPWRIVVAYSLNGQKQNGVWSFDVKKLLLSPENDIAVTLSTQNQLTEAPKLKPVEVVTEPVAESSIIETAALPETQRLETVIPIGRASDRVLIEKPASEPAKIAESKDLLDALKKKREERATQTVAIEVKEVEVVDSPENTETPAPAPAPIRRSGRPSIPSFDEIVQGTKSEDE
ncbi:MAG: hypothetical protein RLZZ471_37 [Actinomycetota bacterium]|jgi:hypothetical protein